MRDIRRADAVILAENRRFSSQFGSATSALRGLVRSNLPFEEWTSVFQSQCLTGALLDRLTHHVHILKLNGKSYRLKQSKARRRREAQPADLAATAADPETGEITRAS
jgi:IstB-like ATP binding protein